MLDAEAYCTTSKQHKEESNLIPPKPSHVQRVGTVCAMQFQRGLPATGERSLRPLGLLLQATNALHIDRVEARSALLFIGGQLLVFQRL